MFRVAYNEAMGLIRWNTIQRKSLNQLGQTTKFFSNDSPDQRLLDDENIEQIRLALTQLPESQQAVVKARIYENKTFNEIAQDLDIPLGTVLTRMRLALKFLSSRLDHPS